MPRFFQMHKRRANATSDLRNHYDSGIFAATLKGKCYFHLSYVLCATHHAIAGKILFSWPRIIDLSSQETTTWHKLLSI